MQRKRIVWFLVTIAAGLAVGLVYGWMINPVKYVDAPASALRSDYKTDYVLMTAEIYKMDGNLENAARRLSLLGSQPPAQIVADGLSTARSLGYAPADLASIETLSRALQKQPGTPQPGAKP